MQLMVRVNVRLEGDLIFRDFAAEWAEERASILAVQVNEMPTQVALGGELFRTLRTLIGHKACAGTGLADPGADC